MRLSEGSPNKRIGRKRIDGKSLFDVKETENVQRIMAAERNTEKKIRKAEPKKKEMRSAVGRRKINEGSGSWVRKEKKEEKQWLSSSGRRTGDLGSVFAVTVVLQLTRLHDIIIMLSLARQQVA